MCHSKWHRACAGQSQDAQDEIRKHIDQSCLVTDGELLVCPMSAAFISAKADVVRLLNADAFRETTVSLGAAVSRMEADLTSEHIELLAERSSKFPFNLEGAAALIRRIGESARSENLPAEPSRRLRGLVQRYTRHLKAGARLEPWLKDADRLWQRYDSTYCRAHDLNVAPDTLRPIRDWSERNERLLQAARAGQSSTILELTVRISIAWKTPDGAYETPCSG